MKRLCIIAGLFLMGASLAHCQGLEVQAGASSLFQADGIQVLWNQGNTTAEADAGTVQGHFQFGAGVHLLRGKCDWWFGDRQLYLSTASIGVSSALRGVAGTCGDPKHRTVTFFTGATGLAHSTPFYNSTAADHFGAGVLFTQIVDRFKFTAVAADDGSRRKFLEGVQFTDNAVRLEETGGFVNDAGYLEGQGTYRRKHFRRQSEPH